MSRALMYVGWMFTILSGALCAAQGSKGARALDTRNSKLIVHVSKSGLFSMFADDHEVEAPIKEGFVDESSRQVMLEVKARDMKVLDPHLSAGKREQVQARMLGPDVLDVARFPQIKFVSTSVEQAGPGHLLVRGQLSLHGVTRPVMASVRAEPGHYVGYATLQQRDFGITPVTIAGGTVRVKDKLRIEFDIRTSTAAPAPTSK